MKRRPRRDHLVRLPAEGKLLEHDTIREIPSHVVKSLRLARSGLTQPFESAEDCAEALMGVQAQMLSAATLAFVNRVSHDARSETPIRAALDHALYESRKLVRLWGQRTTLHVYSANDWPLLVGALAASPTWWERAQRTVPPAVRRQNKALLIRIEKAALAQADVGRSDLRDTDNFSDVMSPWGGAFLSVARRGLICHARPRASEARYAHRERWLPELFWEVPEVSAANVELVRRYLRAYGPATLADVSHWRGLPQRVVTPWVIATGAVSVSVDGRKMLALAADFDGSAGTFEPRAQGQRQDSRALLLGRFDPTLLAHKDKSWLLEKPEDYARIWRPAGHVEACVLIGGHIAGTWTSRRTTTGLQFNVMPFRPLATAHRRNVVLRAETVAQQMGTRLARLAFSG